MIQISHLVVGHQDLKMALHFILCIDTEFILWVLVKKSKKVYYIFILLNIKFCLHLMKDALRFAINWLFMAQHHLLRWDHMSQG